MEKETVDEMLKACRLGDVNMMESLLSRNPEILNSMDSNLGWTPLYRTVICGHEEAARFLLSQGADPNSRTKMGETSLHQAADNSKLQIAQSLLEHKADPDLQQNDGDTALHYAAFKADLQMTDLLLSHQANPNIQNSVFGRTPLHYASENGAVQVAQSLIKAGADFTSADKAGQRPIDICRNEEMQALLEDNESSISCLTFSNSSDSPSRKDCEEPVEAEIENCFEPDAERTEGKLLGIDTRSALFNWLVSYRLEELFEFLFEAGYDDLDQIRKMNTQFPLNEELLKSIGIKKSGHRRRLLAAIDDENRPKNAKVATKKQKPSIFKCCVTPMPAHGEVFHLPSLYKWLETLGLGHHYDDFTDNGYEELEYLLALMHTQWEINDKVLVEIGVCKQGYRQRILAKLREDCKMVDGLRRYGGGFTTRRRREEVLTERNSNDSNCILM